MSHKWKIAAAVVGVVIVAIAAIPLFINVNTFRPLLESQLTQQLGRQVKLGELSLHVFSGDIVAHDLSIADDPQFGTTPFLTASALHIGVEMRPLIFGRTLHVRSLEVESPRIHLVHAANGLWNFSSLAKNAARTPNPQQPSAIPNLAVGEFSITDGTATVESLPAHGAPWVFTGVEVDVKEFSFTNQFPFTMKAKLPGDGTAEISGKAGPIDQQNAVKTKLEVQLTLRHLDPVAGGFLDKSAGLSMLADVDAHAASNGEVLTSNGTVHAQHLQLRPDAVPAPKPVDITYNVTHNIAANNGQLQDAAAQTGKLTTHLSGSYDLQPASPVLHMKLIGQSLPIDELQTLLPAAGVKLPTGSVLQGGTLTTNLSITGPLSALVISGPVDVENTRLAGFNISSQLKGVANLATGNTGDVTNIQKLHTDLQVTKEVVHADNIYISLPAIGEAVGSGTVSAGGALNFKVSLKVDTSHGIGGAAVGMLTKLNGTSGKTAQQAASTGVPVTITGTSSHPIITPDVSGALKRETGAIFSPKSPLGSLFKKH